MSALRKPKHLNFIQSLGKVANKGLSYLGKGVSLGQRGINKAEKFYHDQLTGVRRDPDLAPILKALEHNPLARGFITAKETVKDLLEDGKLGVNWAKSHLHPTSRPQLAAPVPAAASFMRG